MPEGTRGYNGRAMHIDTGTHMIALSEQRMTQEDREMFFATREFPLQKLESQLDLTHIDSAIKLPSNKESARQKEVDTTYKQLLRDEAVRFLSALLPNQDPTTFSQGAIDITTLVGGVAAKFAAERNMHDKDRLQQLLNSFLDGTDILGLSDEEKSTLEDFYQFQKNTYTEPLHTYLTSIAPSIERRAMLTIEQFHDPKSGLLTHEGLTAHYRSITEQAAREKAPKMVLGIYFDIDSFKQINDTLGHTIADEALKQIGKITQKLLRKNDAGGRLGGDEFCMIIQVKPSEVEELIDRLNKTLRKPVARLSNNTDVYVSGGAVLLDPKTNSFEEIQQRAEIAGFLSKAKKTQQHGVLLEGEEMYEAFRAEIETLNGYEQFVKDLSRHLMNRQMNDAETILHRATTSNDTAAIQLAQQLVVNTQKLGDTYEANADLLVRLAAMGQGTNQHLIKLVKGARLPEPLLS